MQARPDQLDAIAAVVSFFELSATIERELTKIGVATAVFEALRRGLEAGAFTKFTGAGHISAKACRKLLPHLEQGLGYHEACRLSEYNHAASGLSHHEQVCNKQQFNGLVADLGGEIKNPIARKALTEALKQLWAMRNHWGLPGAIHIELARDVGNSLEERRKLEKGIEDATKQRDAERNEVREKLAITDVDGTTLLKYRLWKEQNGKCLYTGGNIALDQVVATDNSVQIDHILPWSRFGDDSFNNKSLCLASANQHKGGQTPYEWFYSDKSPEDWEGFVQRVETSEKLRGFKKRNYLLKNAEARAEKFRERNLNDTRYAARWLAEAVKLFFPVGDRQEKGGKRRVFTRPGALTAVLRQAWGLEALKKIDGKRVNDDRHHGLDALVVAATSEGEVQRLTKCFQEWERQGLARPLRFVAPPWPDFRQDARAAYDKAFVTRPERRRARGEGHEATIRQIGQEDQALIVYERKPIAKLKAGDLDRIKDAGRNGAIVDAIRRWIEAGQPKDKDALPRSPRGDIIAKVRLKTTIKPAIAVRGGTADRGRIVRVDVFSKPNAKGRNAGRNEWYLVPVYTHQVMNRKEWPNPPMHFVVASKDEKEWPEISADHKFCFSLYPRSYVKIVKSKGEIIEGYFAGLDRAGGKIAISSSKNLNDQTRNIGAKTLLEITKYSVDRLGFHYAVKREVRTWHGAVCISPNPPG